MHPTPPHPPLPLHPQVRELVDALVARGSLHSLSLHGVAISLVTRRDWLLRQLSRLAPLGLQAVDLSFGRHALIALPSWLRRRPRGGGRGHAPDPDPKDVKMLDDLAAALAGVPELHLVMHDGELQVRALAVAPCTESAPPACQRACCCPAVQ